MPSTTAAEARDRLVAYAATAATLLVMAALLTAAEWRTGPAMHALHETASTSLALVIGCLALVRHYSRRESLFLLIGVAFLGTGALDAYHMIVTFIAPSEATAGAGVIAPWSWLASRLFLSIFLLRLSFLPRLQLGRRAHTAREPFVFAVGMLLVAVALLVLALVPLPMPYRPGTPLALPFEIVPAALLLAALALQLRTRTWRRNVFEHWLVLSLVLGFASQVVFMAWSRELYDPWFDVAHLAKTASYACVLVGLLMSVFFAYRRLEENRYALASANVALQHEIEVRQRAERDLHIRSAYLEQLIEVAPEAIVVVDAHDRVLRANAEFTNIFGYGPAEAVGRTIRELIVPADAGREAEAVSRAVGNGLTVSYETVRRRRDGSSVDVSIMAAPIRDADGTNAAYGIYRDIGERKRAERERRESAERLDSVITAAPVGLVTLDAAGTVRTWNPMAERVLGIPARQVLGKPLPRLTDDAEAARALDRALEGGRVDGLAFGLAGGAGRVTMSAAPLEDGSDAILLAFSALAARRGTVQIERKTVDLAPDAPEGPTRFEWRPGLARDRARAPDGGEVERRGR